MLTGEVAAVELADQLPAFDRPTVHHSIEPSLTPISHLISETVLDLFGVGSQLISDLIFKLRKQTYEDSYHRMQQSGITTAEATENMIQNELKLKKDDTVGRHTWRIRIRVTETDYYSRLKDIRVFKL